MAEARNTNADARAAILASIRQSLAASRPFDAEHQKHHHSSAAPVVPTVPFVPLETLIENFRSSLTFVGADFRVVRSEHEAAEEVRAVIESHSAKQIAVSDSPLVAELMPNIGGIEVLKNAEPSDLFNCDLGLTSAQWGIAETGTLVLESERESHRLTSLVPPVHLCILRAADIRQTLGEILELINEDLSRTVTFITGASRTSDIELTLAIGVHGPKELHVIVIND
jgi:L-lactate dehydrogenase complex protein LldG